MTFNVTSPVTGAAQTGLTSPTYTIVADTPPNPYGKQWFVSVLGGTQTGVTAHSVSSPFTIAQFRPPVYRLLDPINPNTGRINSIPTNVYKTVTRKGVIPIAGQPAKPLVITTTIEVPAGSDVADPLSIKAALSLHIGAVYQQASGLGDTTVQGSI